MSAVEVYVDAFVARCDVLRRPGQPTLDAPGVLGLLPFAEQPVARLLVTDDGALDLLASLLGDLHAGLINVFAGASRCSELVAGDPAWRPENTTALVHQDLRAVPAESLPNELRLQPVRRCPDDPPEGVPLEDAAAVAMRADPRLDAPIEAFTGYLRGMPAATRLFAALDGGGVVRATSGYGLFGTAAGVMFVNTDPGWRRRGIGRAMTAAALYAARDAGARRACLDATDDGLSIYRRLGFAVASRTTRYLSGL